jgi:hypothetical protein
LINLLNIVNFIFLRPSMISLIPSFLLKKTEAIKVNFFDTSQIQPLPYVPQNVW